MARLTDDEWSTVQDGLDTPAILSTIDAVDRLRHALADSDNPDSPSLRDEVLKLYQLGMAVQQYQSDEQAAEFFELASDLEMQAVELREALDVIQTMLSNITELYPESLSYEDGDDE
ncbi:transposase [Chromobacterium fluminis]|nr:transposase [Chromobacterium haemolyticum]